MLNLGRYVDDFVVVANLDSDEDLKDVNEILEGFLPRRRIETGDSGFLLDTVALGRRGSEFAIQPRKCKVHCIGGRAGIGFLSEIAKSYTGLLSGQRNFWILVYFRVEKGVA